jgi:hypothetical protein
MPVNDRAAFEDIHPEKLEGSVFMAKLTTRFLDSTPVQSLNEQALSCSTDRSIGIHPQPCHFSMASVS